MPATPAPEDRAEGSATADRTYPRNWFQVSNYGGGITEREFVRETDKMLVFLDYRGRERADAKQSSYNRWYPTREEAEAAQAEIRAHNDAKDAERRIRSAAPELLEALERLVSACVATGTLPGEKGRELLARSHAAIAKARGQ